MKATKKKPTPHNPDNVTPAQLNPKGDSGWRFLERDEIKRRQELSEHIEGWFANTDSWDGHLPLEGCSKVITYRTRLTRAELAKLK